MGLYKLYPRVDSVVEFPNEPAKYTLLPGSSEIDTAVLNTELLDAVTAA